MKLALIGADAESLDLVRRVVQDSHAELVLVFDAGPHAAEVRELAPAARLNEDWESLVLGSAVDLVIIGRGRAGLAGQSGIADDDRRDEQLRKLAQAAVPMAVFVPACQSIVGYEIEMIRRDSGGWIEPYIPRQPRLDRCDELVRQAEQSPLGPLEQIVIQRQLESRTRDEVLMHLARDVALLRQFLGDITKVTASGPHQPVGRDPLGPKSAALPSLANLTVHLQGDRPFSGRWSVEPVTDAAGARLIIQGAQRAETIWLPAAGQQAGIDDAVPDLLERIERQIAGQGPPPDAWLSACRDQEVAEAVDRSLARGRTIELFNEEISEEQSFKGVMSMGGCLLLMMALAVVGLATIVEGLQLPLRDWAVWQWWPAYLLVPVVLFLLLQLLQFAIKRESPAEDPTPARSVSEGR